MLGEMSNQPSHGIDVPGRSSNSGREREQLRANTSRCEHEIFGRRLDAAAHVFEHARTTDPHLETAWLGRANLDERSGIGPEAFAREARDRERLTGPSRDGDEQPL